MQLLERKIDTYLSEWKDMGRFFVVFVNFVVYVKYVIYVKNVKLTYEYRVL